MAKQTQNQMDIQSVIDIARRSKLFTNSETNELVAKKFESDNDTNVFVILTFGEPPVESTAQCTLCYSIFILAQVLVIFVLGWKKMDT